jgi:hypothetical protein
MSPGAIALLVLIPVALVGFAIDGVILLRGDDADRAAAAAEYAARAAAAASKAAETATASAAVPSPADAGDE